MRKMQRKLRDSVSVNNLRPPVADEFNAGQADHQQWLVRIADLTFFIGRPL